MQPPIAIAVIFYQSCLGFLLLLFVWEDANDIFVTKMIWLIFMFP